MLEMLGVSALARDTSGIFNISTLFCVRSALPTTSVERCVRKHTSLQAPAMACTPVQAEPEQVPGLREQPPRILRLIRGVVPKIEAVESPASSQKNISKSLEHKNSAVFQKCSTNCTKFEAGGNSEQRLFFFFSKVFVVGSSGYPVN